MQRSLESDPCGFVALRELLKTVNPATSTTVKPESLEGARRGDGGGDRLPRPLPEPERRALLTYFSVSGQGPVYTGRVDGTPGRP